MKKRFVILIAGPPGVGKTTLSKMLSRYYGCAYISEDTIAKEVFPKMYQHIEDYPDQLKAVEGELLEQISRRSNDKAGAIIDLVNLGRISLKRIRKDCGNRLVIRVLFPPVETIMERDKRRAGWTSGVSDVKKFYKKYQELKPVIGESQYIDNSNQTPRQTLEMIIGSIDNVNEA